MIRMILSKKKVPTRGILIIKKVDDRRHGAMLSIYAPFFPPARRWLDKDANDDVVVVVDVIIYFVNLVAIWSHILPCISKFCGTLFSHSLSPPGICENKITEALIRDHQNGLDVAGVKIPSLSWVEYRFSPAHSSHGNALRHTSA